MSTGMIHGGIGYLWAAYGVAWGGLALYILSLVRRSRAHRGGDR